MSVNESATEIAEQAAAWAIRIDAGSLDPESDATLRAWVEGDPRRRGALLRAEAALSFVDRGRALAGVIPKPERGAFWGRGPFVLAAVTALAASLAAIIFFVPRTHHYDTAIGEIRQLPLADGSLLAINTQSEVEVALHRDLREVTLDRGEAWFKVAHDTSRPFVVSAGRVRVRAVGTAFSVRRREAGADVSVTEGVVETWRVGDESHRLRIAAGSQAYVAEASSGDTSPQPVQAAARIERDLAWREGQIVLQGETLAEAAAQFNRYNFQQLVISDPQLAQEKLVGQFRATEPLTFAGALSTTLGVTVKQHGDTIELTRQIPH